MKINIGSQNPNKILAATETLQEYEQFKTAEFFSVNAKSYVSNQPKSLDEMIRGAQNRAFNSFAQCDISIGLESGIMPAPRTITGYLGPCACVIYDGKEFYVGLGPAFEYPREVIKGIIEQGLEVDEAFHKAGFSENQRIGYSNGVIGWLTNDAVTRKDLLKQATKMALASFLNKELY